MQSPKDWLTPDALFMLQTIAEQGSFAAAARKLGLVPSALTYRVRQLEDALDVLLFDRSARQARPTAAGQELLREAGRLLQDIDAVANRVKRVATGWEAVLTVAVDSIMAQRGDGFVRGLFGAEQPHPLAHPTRNLVRHHGRLDLGQADLALGVALGSTWPQTSSTWRWVKCLLCLPWRPSTPWPKQPEPLSNAQLVQHRMVAVADSVQRGSGLTVGLQGGQDVFTVPDMPSKLQAQLRGLGAGFLPQSLAHPMHSKACW
jgi:DNA-binding transcriptional LysR family regulator